MGVISIALELFSHPPVLRLQMLITDCCLTSQHPLCLQSAWCVCVCVGKEKSCDGQRTEAHYGNAHPIAKERRFSYLSYSNHKKNINQTVIRYSMI